jgi:hypothetical protein
MKILNYKYLNEAILPSLANAGAATGINQGDLDALVRVNLRNSTTMDDAAVVESYRLISFSFVNKQSYNSFLNNQITANGLDVRNNMSYRFFTYYENDDCFLYPFTGVDVPRFGLDKIKSYIKLNLFKKINETQPEDIEIFFNEFGESRNASNEYNVKNYSLEILSNFNDINRENKISNEEVINLPNYAATDPSQTNYYLSFNSVSQPVSVVNGQRKGNIVDYNITFYPTTNTPQSGSATINSFNTLFSRSQLKIHQQTNTPNQNISQNYPSLTIFKTVTGTLSYYIYTRNKILTYQGQGRTDCFIGTNPNEFIECELNFIIN